MSEDRNDLPAEHHIPLPAAPEAIAADQMAASPPPGTPAAAGARSTAALWLAGLLVLLIGAIASSPFWAPMVAPLLPWGVTHGAGNYNSLADRVAALEHRPAPPSIDVDAIKSEQAELARRGAALEANVAAALQHQGTAEATKTTLMQLTQRVDAIEAQSTARATGDAAEIRKIQQDLAQRSSASGDLVERLAALEHQVQARSNADRNGSVLLLALLQMREAIEQSQPFATEYAVFEQLLAHDADLAAAAAPLAAVARDGVASRAVLRGRLSDLARQLATVRAPAIRPEWWGQALARLSELVTIRHIGGAAKTGVDAAVSDAQSALAGDDLAAAVAALDKLTGADGEAARPWLRMARQRLAAESSLTHLQELLTAHLGAAPAATPTSVPSPAPTPPATSRAPS